MDWRPEQTWSISSSSGSNSSSSSGSCCGGSSGSLVAHLRSNTYWLSRYCVITIMTRVVKFSTSSEQLVLKIYIFKCLCTMCALRFDMMRVNENIKVLCLHNTIMRSHNFSGNKEPYQKRRIQFSLSDTKVIFQNKLKTEFPTLGNEFEICRCRKGGKRLIWPLSMKDRTPAKIKRQVPSNSALYIRPVSIYVYVYIYI